MNVYKGIEELQKRIEASPRLPWFWRERSVVNRASILRCLQALYESLPKEIQEANQILIDAKKIRAQAQQAADKTVSEAEDQARGLVRAAKEDAERLVRQTEIVATARKEAERVAQEAEAKAKAREAEAEAFAQKVRREAQDYSDTTCRDAERYAYRVFCGMESSLEKVSEVIKRAKAGLGEAASAEAFGESPEEKNDKKRKPL